MRVAEVARADARPIVLAAPGKAPAWTPEQDAVIWDRAGLVSMDELARLVSAAGPARTAPAVKFRALSLDIPLRKRQRRVYRQHGWSADEERLLRDLAGRVLLPEITRRLNERFKTRRRDSGVQSRLSKLGLSTVVDELLPAYRVQAILAIGPIEMARILRSGELAAERQSSGPGGEWGVRPAALEAYFRAYPERITWQRVPAGPWRDRARAVAIRHPSLTLAEAAARAGVSRAGLHRQLRAGQVPGAVKYGREWRIPLAALDAIRRPRAPGDTMYATVLAALTGEWQTARAIGAALGITERAVYTAMRSLRRRGHAVESRPGVGMRRAAS